MFPDRFLLPAVALAAIATTIASQAVISGAYSVSCEAMKLGFLPRMEVCHKIKRD
jgi:KUP system potassium uptake protein